MEQHTDDRYPALKMRRNGLIDQHVDEARRVLWRAYQHGRLSEEEFADTLDRLDYVGPESPMKTSPTRSAT